MPVSTWSENISSIYCAQRGICNTTVVRLDTRTCSSIIETDNRYLHANRPVRILVANDDGIDSAGLSALAAALEQLGEVWIVAPRTPQSAMGRALTLFKPINVIQKKTHCYAVDGTPSDCVNIALNRLLPDRPALVVSGINTGPNMGDDIPYSGTVAAAFEAAIRGIPAMAVSLACLLWVCRPYRKL